MDRVPGKLPNARERGRMIAQNRARIARVRDRK
jgi:hypothetical protein